MQAFKYDQSPKRSHKPSTPPGGPIGRLITVAVLGLMGAAAWNTAPGMFSASALGWSVKPAALARPAALRAHEAMQQGEASLTRGAAGEAVQHFDEALRLAPSLTAAYERGLVARALAHVKAHTAADLLPDQASRVTFLLARSAHDDDKRPAAALDDCVQALALAPSDPQGLRARAALLEKSGDLKEAIAAYEQALHVIPDDVPLATSLIQLRFRSGDSDQAMVETRTRLVPLATTSHEPLVHITLICSAIEQGLAPDAVRAQSLTVSPNLSAVERELFTAQAYLLHFQENPNWHRSSLTRALEASNRVLSSKAGATLQQQRDAREVMLEALATHAAHLANRSDTAGARSALDRALALRPHLVGQAPRFTARFADLYVQRAHLGPEGEVANRAMEAAVALVPDHPVRQELARVDANLGVSLLGANKAAQALKPLERAFELDPHDPSVLARYHQALLATHSNAPLLACTKASVMTARGPLVATLLQGYVRAKLPRLAERLADSFMASLTPADRALARAELLVGAGKTSEARQRFLKATQTAPTAALWRRLAALDRDLAGSLKGTARFAALDQARAEYLQALAVGGDVHDRALMLGMAHEQVTCALASGDFAAAHRAANLGLQLDPRNAALGLALATTLAKAEDVNAAIVACQEGLKGLSGPADPLNAPLRDRLGTLYRGQKHYAAAVAEYKLGLETQVHAAPALVADLTYGLALAHAGNGDREAALNAIRQYVAVSAHDPHQSARVAEVQALELDVAARQGT